MTPAIITLNVKYELNSNESDQLLKRIYDNCNTEFTRTKAYLVDAGMAVTMPYKDYAQNLKDQINGDLNKIIQSLLQFQDFKIPGLIDKSGSIKFSYTNISFEIDDSNGLVIFLIFKTELMTLIGTINETLILSLGDNLNSIANNTFIDVFSLKYGDYIWIDTYRK